MGTTTNGQICYGVMIEEDFELPWDKSKYNYDIDEWWLVEVLKFKSSFEIYNEDGEHLNGVKPEKEMFDSYYEEKEIFIEENKKLPIKLVNYCSGDCPMYIIATPENIITANRGYPEKLDLEKLIISQDDKTDLMSFCENHNIEYSDQPQWILSSYWG